MYLYVHIHAHLPRAKIWDMTKNKSNARFI